MSARKGLTYLLGGNAGGFVIQFAASVAMARLLTPGEMGVYAASMAIVWIINGVLNVGLQSYCVREREMPPEKLGTVLLLTLVQSAVFGLGLLIAAPLIGGFARDHRVTESIIILSWFGALMPVLVTSYGLMQRAMRFERVVICTLSNIGISAAVTIALAAQGYSWRSMPIGSGVGVTFAVVLALWFQRAQMLRTPLSRAYIGPIMVFGSRIFSASLILNITNRVPDIVLTRAAGTAATGLYNRGANLVDNFNNTLMKSFSRVLASQMARDRQTPAGIGPVYARMSRLITGLFWPAFAVLGVLAAPIVAFLFGPKWVAAGPVLSIVAAAGAINLAVASRSEVLVTSGRERELPRNEAIRGVIGVTLFTLAAYSGGLILAASTRIVDAVVAVILYSPGIRAATGLSRGEMWRAFARSALVAAATAAPAVIGMALLGWPNALRTIELFGMISACGVAWFVSLFLLRHELAHEVANVFAKARARLPRLA